MSAEVLRQLRDRLTLEEAAEHLSKLLDEKVTAADVLRLALDGDLRLALYLPVKVIAQCHLTSDTSLDPTARGREIQGLCDLPMEGRARAEIEHRYHWLERQHYVPRKGPVVGAWVEQHGFSCRVPPDQGERGMWTRAESEFPNGSLLCVRREALDEFLAALEKRTRSEGTEPEQIDPRELDTLSMMIAALAKAANVDLAHPWKAAETIVSLIDAIGYRRSSGSIYSHLKRIEKQFPGRDG